MMAARRQDEEICGLLLGRDGHVMRILPVANRAAAPGNRFLLDPAEHVRAQRQARREGMAIIGHYHSHPSGDVSPSPVDAEMAYGDGALWLICAPSGEYHVWRAAGSGLHGQFQPVVADII